MKKLVIKYKILFDDLDEELVALSDWSVNRNGYAESTDRVLMHRLVTNCPKGFVVDHINGNRLDNRRINLRICTQSQNMINKKKSWINKSGFIGVYKQSDKARPDKNKWIAQITINRKNKNLGCYITAEGAARARDEAAKIYYGEFARLNFP